MFKNDNNEIQIPVQDSDGNPIPASDFVAAKLGIYDPRSNTELFTATLGSGLSVESDEFIAHTSQMDLTGLIYIELRARDVAGREQTLLSTTENLSYTRLTL